MTVKTIKFDPARYLNSEERIAAYLEEILENGTDTDFIRALNTVARAWGMTDLARRTGVTRESLYKTLSSEAPSWGRLRQIIEALGVKIRFIGAHA